MDDGRSAWGWAGGIDSKGDVSVGYSSPVQHIGGKLQGKIAYKRCAKF